MTSLDLAKELDKIISKGAISPLFQPIFNILEHKIHGFEALSRGPEHSPLYSPVPLFRPPNIRVNSVNSKPSVDGFHLSNLNVVSFRGDYLSISHPRRC